MPNEKRSSLGLLRFQVIARLHNCSPSAEGKLFRTTSQRLRETMKLPIASVALHFKCRVALHAAYANADKIRALRAQDVAWRAIAAQLGIGTGTAVRALQNGGAA